MENKSKAETFIGFAIKSGKFRSGANTLATIKKAFLILVCKTAAENTVKSAIKYAQKYHCKVFRTESVTLSDISHKDGIKIAAVTDLKLAQAIIDNVEPNLEDIS